MADRTELPPEYARIERIAVQSDRMVVRLALSEDAPRYTTVALAHAACERIPQLPLHSCKNSVGRRFGDVMACTPVPHLFEHLVIQCQCEAAGDGEAAAPAPGAPAAPGVPDDFLFVGTTEWVSEAAGTAQVTVNFADDIAALRALRDALAILNSLLSETC